MNTQFNDKIFEQFPVLESPRLTLREFTQADAQVLFQIRSNAQIMEYMDSYTHQSIDDTIQLIDNLHTSFNEKKGISWAIVEKSKNEIIGYFGFWRLIPEHCRAEIGYALLPEHWGKGYMKEAMKILIKFGFTQLKIHSIEANVNPQNDSSIHLLSNLGFKQEAYFRENFLYEGKFIDSMIFCLLETDY